MERSLGHFFWKATSHVSHSSSLELIHHFKNTRHSTFITHRSSFNMVYTPFPFKQSVVLFITLHCCCFIPSTTAWTNFLERRDIIQQSLLLLLPPPETALRRVSAKIPGYGAPDVYYPVEWQGTWKMRRQVSFKDADTSPLLLEYPIRFLLFDENTVIADRAFNQVNLENALNTTPTTTTVRSSQWSSTNPNVLRIEYSNGKTKEIKVTKRATERANTTVFSSEFQLVTQEDDRGIPIVFPRRVVTKWRTSDDDTVEGLEMVYDTSDTQQQQQQQQQLLSKSRILLQRL